MKRLLAIAALGIALAACSTLGIPSPKSPAQTVYAAKATFLAAVTTANAYKALPACGGAAVICSSPNIVSKLQLSASAAKTTLDAAQATVTDPAFSGGNTDAAVVAAENAVSAFASITSQLKVQ